ncbi:MAG: 50S ribosomal protein L7ae [Clostridiales bacterium]|nr:50S ribosomal protein L7ae [Clostridiales bacterium]
MYQLIGLAKRAGRLVSGSYAVEKAIKSGKAQLVILSHEASSNTIKKFLDMCKYRGIDIIRFGDRQDLGQSIGKPERIVLAIIDPAFKNMILGALPSSIINMGVSD